KKRAKLKGRQAELVIDERTYAQQLELLKFQVKEIAAARFQPDEEEQLERDFNRSSNAARLLELCQSILGLIGESEDSLLNRTRTLGRLVQELRRLDSSGQDFVLAQEQVVDQLQGLQHEVSAFADKVEVDPKRLRALEERLNLLASLKRKYGASIGEINAFGETARVKLEALEHHDEELNQVETELGKISAEHR